MRSLRSIRMSDIPAGFQYVPQPPAAPYTRDRTLIEVGMSARGLTVYINEREVDKSTAGRILIKVGHDLAYGHLPVVNIFNRDNTDNKKADVTDKWQKSRRQVRAPIPRDSRGMRATNPA